VSTLFGRRWRITIGEIQSETVDLRFKVTRTLTARPGAAEIDVFNLSPDHRRELAAARRPLVRIEVGYRSVGPWIAFQGDGRRTLNTRDSADWITKVTAGDGEHALRSARLSRSFAPDVQLADVVRYVAGAMAVDTGNVLEQLQSRGLDRLGDAFPGGVVLHGLAEMHLRQILDSAGLSWSVQDGVLQVVPRGRALRREAVLLSSSTGMIGSPEVDKSNVVKVNALLTPDLVPGQLVQIESRVVSGTFRIERTEATGDTRGDDWQVAMEVRTVRDG
jgi:hypothetical protein